MKNKKMKVLSVAMAGCMALGMTACGSTADTSSVVTAENAESQEITLKMAFWDISKAAYVQAVIDAYEQEHPNVTIEALDIPNDGYDEKITVMLSGGDDTDLICVRSMPQLAGMVQKHQLEPLGAYLEESGMDMTPFAGTDEQIKMDGEAYAIPFRSDYWVTFYNKDLFDAAGVEYPTDMTWDEYRELAKKMTSGSGNDKIYGSHIQTWFSAVACWSNVGGEETLVDGEYSALAPYYELALGMQNEDQSVMDYASLKMSNIHYSAPFYKGQVAMIPMGTWFINMLLESEQTGETNINWGICPAPHAEGVEAGNTFGNVTPIGINAKSKNKEAAWDFIQYMCGEEGAKIMAEMGILPAYKTPEIMDIITSVEGFPQECKDALNVKNVALEFPPHAKGSAIDKALGEEHELIMLGELSVEEGINEMNQRVSELLAEE